VVLAGFLVGTIVGFGLAVSLFRIYLQRHPRELVSIDASATGFSMNASLFRSSLRAIGTCSR
jgi:hypothetical protein